MIVAIVIFFLSLLGIVGLFGLKHWEEQKQRVVAQDMRVRADERALEFKTWLENSRGEFKKLPPALLRLSRIAIHEAALGAAASARFIERQAHRLADMVSHKHHFERREPRSDFLKQMTDHKNGNGAGLGEKDNI
ncbi:hypothetical protein A3C20_02655 [Candidatus Kaiserbacteria bacterium RIFCSPHIGHO2_02_FULL_55_25]|uniref:Uncharacterized protein n=1 Tax=Candidatus Kaiserbacteria bacterium RIFCSPHIGHO2_02_FULL_55_25 TaxID=1798498 RepID=A0A1F6E900_9BACT|nr:MAG: hypothetical protein A2764_03215 [Candidatus Kaiserbacteria bacterium RIFCSPHIGHO2_01_FULL_55_79]OGG70047.1 MAG: hypothetical protein A3C20_02655 [Candidatus Kaiserbacteria bacterium RIFCSPHIGHO2_02_FULL_55_25]OGG77486.1 MAG: hypothetical protein A3F56_01285 [Candidatus Kaiserbacteria bacterium RIFCSPHIGHO2_12_FULL_55_13]OGG82889.1 MAG: hypothetical protein A3A42_01020 [Candidatus Kaiserbacteria bacterium RIFCSPLOWO2_01_FULL_55_25]